MKIKHLFIGCTLLGMALTGCCGASNPIEGENYSFKDGMIVFDEPARAAGQESMLGFAADAKAAMEKFAAVVNGTGAKVLLVSNPAAADALKCDFAAAGVTLVPEVKFTAGYFVKLAEEGRLSFAGKTGVASYLPSDYLKNYLKCGCAKKLLALLGVQDRMFGTNIEESYTAGEGALVLDRLYPELVKMLAGKIAAQAEADVPVIVASTYTAGALEAAGLKCTTLEEAAEADLCSLR